MRMNRKSIVGTVALLIVVSIVGIVLFSNRERPYDPNFDARVADPAYRGGGTIVLFDEGDLNTRTTNTGYRPLADPIRNDGHDLRGTQQALSGTALESVSALVVVLARGSNDPNDNPAFANSEVAAVDQWVRNGGSLLLVTDRWPFTRLSAPNLILVYSAGSALSCIASSVTVS